MCPFSILAFLQPTTVDKEPLFFNPLQLTKSRNLHDSLIFSIYVFVLNDVLSNHEVRELHVLPTLPCA